MKYLLISYLLVFIPLIVNGQRTSLQTIYNISDSIKYIDLHEFQFNRPYPYSNLANKPFAKILPLLDALTESEINTLLSDDNPRIRALGILTVYQKDDQKLLLRLPQYFADTAECFKTTPFQRFSSRTEFHFTKPNLDSLLNLAKSLTVDGIAKTLFYQYFTLSGRVYMNEELDIFIKENANRNYSAGFLNLLKLKATGGISPFQEERRDLVNQLKERIYKISDPIDKAIYTIYLSTFDYELYSHEERLDALNKLGKKNLKSILSRKPHTTDPTLANIKDSTYHSFEYAKMCGWILQNSHFVFKENDIPYLLARAEYERRFTRLWDTPLHSPYWYIACAKIDPTNSPMYLGFGLSRYTGEYQEFDRAELYAALWHIAGERELAFILDWFFNSYLKNERSRERLDHFIHQLTTTSDLKLIKHIIADDRFYNYIKVSDVKQLAWQVNRILQKEFISHDRISMVGNSIPIWVEQFEESYDNTLEKYPMGVKEILENAEQLKEELRKLN